MPGGPVQLLRHPGGDDRGPDGWRGLDTRIVGIAIDRDAPGDPPYETLMARLATQTARKLGLDRDYRAEDFQVRYDCVGAGYEVVSDAMREAVGLTARLEGGPGTPIYTGRAMSGLMRMIRQGELEPGQTVVFWHTGGLPAIFRFAEAIGSLVRRRGCGCRHARRPCRRP